MQGNLANMRRIGPVPSECISSIAHSGLHTLAYESAMVELQVMRMSSRSPIPPVLICACLICLPLDVLPANYSPAYMRLWRLHAIETSALA